MNALDELREFLPCPTPPAWLAWALAEPELMLIDHANCEKKAASTALNLIYRYVDNFDLLNKMSRLAREELRHFEQVIALMEKRKIVYRQLPAARYAAGLRQKVRTHEPAKLVDTLIVGAFIEARSCERFAALGPLLADAELRTFYRSLLRSEARHFRDYLNLAKAVAPHEVAGRVACFASEELRLIQSPDVAFRFHSGPPD